MSPSFLGGGSLHVGVPVEFGWERSPTRGEWGICNGRLRWEAGAGWQGYMLFLHVISLTWSREEGGRCLAWTEKELNAESHELLAHIQPNFSQGPCCCWGSRPLIQQTPGPVRWVFIHVGMAAPLSLRSSPIQLNPLQRSCSRDTFGLQYLRTQVPISPFIS